MNESEEAPKIQIDADWKTQAQEEKRRLAEQTKTSPLNSAGAEAGTSRAAAGPAPGPGGLPPANWETLLATMATQAIMYLGGMVDPRTNRAIVDLEAARHQIDILGVLEEKTKGNLSDDEAKQLASIIYDLRMRYVQIAQAAAGAGGGGGPVAP